MADKDGKKGGRIEGETEESRVERRRETTRWQSCKVLRVTPGYVMLPAFVLAIPRMVASWTLVYS